MAKVKFLPAEEAIKLKSGTKTETQIKRGNLDSLTDPSDSLSPISKRSRVVAETATPKFLPMTENTNTSYRHSGHLKPLALGGMQTRTASQRGAVPMSESVNGDESNLCFPPQQFSWGSLKRTTRPEERPWKPVAPTVNAEPSSSVVFSWTNIRSSDPELNSFSKDKELKDHVDGESNQGVETGLNRERDCTFCTSASPNFHELPKRNVPRASSEFQNYPSNGPSLEIIWRGNFEVLDIVPDVRLCEGLLAHPPAKVSRKAYEFSKQIAGVLQFKLHPRRDLWPKIYQIECPDANDIALYFYPGNFERSRKKYSNLLKFIEKHDLVLRSHMGCVELLVFASKQLHKDFQREIGRQFLHVGSFSPFEGQYSYLRRILFLL